MIRNYLNDDPINSLNRMSLCITHIEKVTQHDLNALKTIWNDDCAKFKHLEYIIIVPATY
jgi:hypothetical protein